LVAATFAIERGAAADRQEQGRQQQTKERSSWKKRDDSGHGVLPWLNQQLATLAGDAASVRVVIAWARVVAYDWRVGSALADGIAACEGNHSVR